MYCEQKYNYSLKECLAYYNTELDYYLFNSSNDLFNYHEKCIYKTKQFFTRRSVSAIMLHNCVE